MNLKAVIKQIASWFRSEAKVGASAASELIIEAEKHMEGTQAANAAPVVSTTPAAVDAAALAGAVATNALGAGTPVVDTSKVNTAIQIALALKSIDSSRTVDQVQAGTNAALAALYPAVA